MPYQTSKHPLDCISLPFLISADPSKSFPHSSTSLSASISKSRTSSISTGETYCASAPCYNTHLLPAHHILNSKSALREQTGQKFLLPKSLRCSRRMRF